MPNSLREEIIARKNAKRKALSERASQTGQAPPVVTAEQQRRDFPPEPGVPARLAQVGRTALPIAGAIGGGMIGAAAAGPAGAGLGLKAGALAGAASAGGGALIAEQISRGAAGEGLLSPQEALKFGGIEAATDVVGGAALKGVAKLGKAAAPTIIGTLQGIPNQLTKFVLEKGPRKTLKNLDKVDPELLPTLVNEFKGSIQVGKGQAIERLERSLSKLVEQAGDPLIKTEEAVQRVGKIVNETLSQIGGKEAVGKTLKSFSEMFAAVASQPALRLSELIALRRNLDKVIPAQAFKKGSKNFGVNMLKKLRGEMAELISTKSKGAAKIFAAEAQILKTFDDVQTAFNAADAPEKIIQFFKREGQGWRILKKADKLVSTTEGLLDRIVGESARKAFSPIFRDRIPITPVGAAFMASQALSGPPSGQALLGAGVLGAAVSPRLAGGALKGAEASADLLRRLQARRLATGALGTELAQE